MKDLHKLVLLVESNLIFIEEKPDFGPGVADQHALDRERLALLGCVLSLECTDELWLAHYWGFA